MTPEGFANPWEHVRLLSDGPRNAALIGLLERRAAGARVLEVGCGSGLLSCIAARLGARAVFAVEPTPLAEVAERLVAQSRLDGVVKVLRGRVEDLPPQPVDLAFSELLNADPFVEGVLPAMDAAARWLGPGGLLAPRRLRVWAALARAGGPAAEARAAQAELRALGKRFGLATDVIADTLATPLPYVELSGSEQPVGPAELVWDLELGVGAAPLARAIELRAAEAGPVGGVLLWFDAELDPNFTLGNAPGADTHWGRLLLGFAVERGVRAGGKCAVELRVEEGRVTGGWA